MCIRDRYIGDGVPRLTDHELFNASFFRLQEVRLTYNLPLNKVIKGQLFVSATKMCIRDRDTDGLFARIIGKISALTILQYINYKNNRPIGRVKYALI